MSLVEKGGRGLGFLSPCMVVFYSSGMPCVSSLVAYILMGECVPRKHCALDIQDAYVSCRFSRLIDIFE